MEVFLIFAVIAVAIIVSDELSNSKKAKNEPNKIHQPKAEAITQKEEKNVNANEPSNKIENNQPIQKVTTNNNKLRPLIINTDRRQGALQVYHQIKDDLEYGETISFCLKGTLLVPHQNYPLAFVFNLMDVTNKDDTYPVFTNLELFRADDDRVEYIFRNKMPYTENRIDNHLAFKIPVKFLEVPFKGERILRVFLVVINEEDSYERPLNIVGKRYFAIDFEEFKVFFEGYGYLQHGEKLSDALCDIVGIASYVAQVDGDFSIEEKKVIQTFVDNKLENVANKSAVEDIRTATLERLEFMLNESNRIAFRNELQNAVFRLKDLAEPSLLTVAYELAVKTVSVDNIIHHSEQSTLNEIASLLGIDYKTKQDINDRYMKMEMFTRTNDEEFLGITANMSVEEKKAHLNQEYNKWRNRVTSPNKAVASEANIRIEKIVKLRQKINT